MHTIVRVAGKADVAVVQQLFKEYADELQENLGFQGFSDELEHPFEKYKQPAGCILLAIHEDEAAGCVAIKSNTDGTCEMKRLYIKPAFRKLGVGKILVDEILKAAEQKNYDKMVLDTLERLQPAIQLYLSRGFTITEPYYSNPLPNVVYMQRELSTKTQLP